MLVGQENGDVQEAASHIHLSSDEMMGWGPKHGFLLCVFSVFSDSTEDVEITGSTEE